MILRFSFLCVLVINVLSTNLFVLCNKLKINGNGKSVNESFFPDGTKNESHMNKNIMKKGREREIPRKETQANIGHHNFHENELKKNIEMLKQMQGDLKNGKTPLHKKAINGADKGGHIGEWDREDELRKYVMEEIRNNSKLDREKKSSEEIKLLEDKSIQLQNDIHTWLQSIHNIEEKSTKLKDIKKELLHNITSLNETLVEEIENINDIKKLQKEQNEIFAENWLYFFPSISDNVSEDGSDSNHNILNYLEMYNKKDKEKQKESEMERGVWKEHLRENATMKQYGESSKSAGMGCVVNHILFLLGVIFLF
ncbi:apical merozoite protein, putative [Plasmodium ovale]|uniref:Apical merozoite protein, putative n=1 Tax=Plasmodium ovale TaxID=36330 RepID=A0A1D3KY77_PLAOA|nr:apical merozoite protein, putative [Plasmodium ovale]